MRHMKYCYFNMTRKQVTRKYEESFLEKYPVNLTTHPEAKTGDALPYVLLANSRVETRNVVDSYFHKYSELCLIMLELAFQRTANPVIAGKSSVTQRTVITIKFFRCCHFSLVIFLLSDQFWCQHFVWFRFWSPKLKKSCSNFQQFWGLGWVYNPNLVWLCKGIFRTLPNI